MTTFLLLYALGMALAAAGLIADWKLFHHICTQCPPRYSDSDTQWLAVIIVLLWPVLLWVIIYTYWKDSK